ncbi:MAG: SDR family oxidoreductase [Rhodospirillales bacterium]|nr:SDR family oxidoreductase [Rhodospirillales bacterium]HJO97918.1 SDR family oxidoreductase [Rhodospirillales bacterium]
MNETPDGFDGKAYVVTGGTQGIGAAAALALAGAGAAGVVICGRNREKGAAMAKAIEDAGASCEYVAADLADADDCRKPVPACMRRFGRVDGLVNAAGLTERGTIEDTTVEFWDHMFAVNTRAPFILIQDAVKAMKQNKIEGSIVNIITMSSHGGQPFLTPYSVSKGALGVLTKNVAHALRFDRIRVNGVNMGWADTPNEHVVQVAEGKAADWLAKAESTQPFGRLIKPDDIARLCLFLLGPQSGLMTGALIDYDQMIMGAYD